MNGEGFCNILELIEKETDLNEKELVQLLDDIEPNANDSDVKDSDCDEHVKIWLQKKLAEGIRSLARKFTTFIMENAPSIEHSGKLPRQLDTCLVPYNKFNQILQPAISKVLLLTS